MEALCDDLNTPEAIKIIDELANKANELRDEFDRTGIHSTLNEAAKIARKMLSCAELLGLLNESSRAFLTGVGLRLHGRTRHFEISAPDVELHVQRRTEAKAHRDFAEADRIRNDLRAKGVVVEDTPAGPKWRRE